MKSDMYLIKDQKEECGNGIEIIVYKPVRRNDYGNYF